MNKHFENWKFVERRVNYKIEKKNREIFFITVVEEMKKREKKVYSPREIQIGSLGK